MKKIILFAAAAIMALGASAQMSLVKDLAKKASSGNPQALMEVLQAIEPAFENPETANDVLTYYTFGKAAFGLYDEMYKMKLLQPDAVDNNMMNEALSAEFDAGNGIVEITFGEALTNVNVKIFKNGMMMDWYIGNAVAGTKYMTPVGNDGSNTGIVLYIVSSGKVCSVISID